jgi:manganese-transporting P-type ATPase C
LQVLSILPGRVRFKDDYIGNSALASFVNAYVDNLYGVTVSRVNPITCTLLVFYDNRKTTYEKLQENIQQTIQIMPTQQDILQHELIQYNSYLSLVNKRVSAGRRFLRFTLIYLLFRLKTPLSRISLGRNLPVLEVASAVTIIGGYPHLRKLFRKSSQHSSADSDILLDLLALTLTLVRQSSNGVLVLALKELNEFIKFSADAEGQRLLSQSMLKNHKMAWVDEEPMLERLVPADSLQVGDIIIVHSGEIVPVDADVMDGQAVINSIYYNGQPIISHIDSGNHVYEGTVVVSGKLKARVVALPAVADKPDLPFDNMKIHQKITSYQDRVTKMALGVATISYLLTGNLLKSLSILLVATPSGAGLALSSGIKSYGALLSKNHIYLRNPNILEKIIQTNQIAFDKTGTLTHGIMQIRKIELYHPDYTQFDLLQIAAACEVDNYHPIALTFQDAVGADYDVTKFKHSILIPSTGIKSDYDGHRILIGNATLLGNEGVDLSTASETINRYERELLTPVLISIDSVLSGIFVLEDILRPGVKELISKLKCRNISTISIMTGDRQEKANAIAAELGIKTVYSECNYADKLKIIEDNQSHDVVMMIGDGINDVSAMKKADVSISLADSAADQAKLASDCIIFEDNLNRLAQLLGLSQKTYLYINQSLLLSQLFSLTYSALAIFTFLDPFRAKSLNTLNSLMVLLLNKRIEFITARERY